MLAWSRCAHRSAAAAATRLRASAASAARHRAVVQRGCARARRFVSASASGWEHHADGEHEHGGEELELDPDEFLSGLLERQQMSRSEGHGSASASFAALWGDGYRDDIDTDWMEATAREGIDPEGERVLAVLPFSSHSKQGAMEWPAKMEEALSLCGSLGRWDVVDALALRARRGRGQTWGKGPNSKSYLRPGQVKAVAQAVQQTSSDAVFIDAILTPMQSRNLGALLGGTQIYDRFGLILAIFAANATTKCGARSSSGAAFFSALLRVATTLPLCAAPLLRSYPLPLA